MKITLRELSDDLRNKINKIDQIETNVNNISLTWDKITGKPVTFQPSEHSHAWENITNKPKHFSPMSHEHLGSDIIDLDNYLSNKLDKIVELEIGHSTRDLVENGIYRCTNWSDAPSGLQDNQGTVININYWQNSTNSADWSYQIFISPHADNLTYCRSVVSGHFYGWRRMNDADTLKGRNAIEFVNFDTNLTVEDLNNPNFPYPYRTRTMEGNSIGLPHLWSHIDFFKHTGVGYGFQIAYPLDPGEGDQPVYYRASHGETWRDWVKLYDSNHKPTPEEIGASPYTHYHSQYPDINVNNIARQYTNTNGVDVSDTNLKLFYNTNVTQNSSMPNGDWWHVINMPHSHTNGYGGQIALGYSNNAGKFCIRSANGTSWHPWRDITAELDELKRQIGESGLKPEKQVAVGQISDGEMITHYGSGYLYVWGSYASSMSILIDGAGTHQPVYATDYNKNVYRFPFREKVEFGRGSQQYTLYYAITSVI